MNFYNNHNELKGSCALRGHITDDKEHYNKVIHKLYLKLYDLNLSLREMPKDGVYGFQKWSSNLVNFKHKILGLTLGKKLNIIIPEIFTKREEFITNSIRGIFDTDGMIYLEPKYGKFYPRIEISTISMKLGYQLNDLIKKMGIRSTIYLDKRENPKWHDSYKISVRGEKMLEKWMNIIDPHNPKHQNKFQFFINNS